MAIVARPSLSTRRKLVNNGRKSWLSSSSLSCSLSHVIVYGMVCIMFLYITAMISLTQTMNSSSNPNNNNNNNNSQDSSSKKISKKNPNYIPNKYSREEWGDRNPPYNAKKEWGEGVKPQLLRKSDRYHHSDTADADITDADAEADGDAGWGEEKENRNVEQDSTTDGSSGRVLTAYLEAVNQSTWDIKPLPIRTTTAQDLTRVSFTRLRSCSKLPEQWPVDEYPDMDPFLPWIHDVFPTHDGTHVQFVAQNKRRCKTGSNAEEQEILYHMQPQIALFEHVAVKRLNKTETNNEEKERTRYRLASHEDADEDGMETRFICRFQPSGVETLSVYNFNYEWASFRKLQKKMFHKEEGDNKQIHTSQLTFLCPVPKSLVETIRTGASVKDDYATLFIDLIPIRTPPRYLSPTSFLPPYYSEFQSPPQDSFHPDIEWGTNHILPKIEDSGRWENIPICKPSLLTYGKQKTDAEALAVVTNNNEHVEPTKPIKQHRLVSCLWASTGYATRGNRFAINDGQRRLLEWINYNKLIGVEHFYLYDNSGAFSDDRQNSLEPIAELFPNDVTVIHWPAKVCNNNPNNVDSVGERSSQYAAEASCRLRFGPHVEWIAQFDIDEYLVPMGNLTSIVPLLDKLDEEGNKIVSFGSWRAWPRRRFIETPVKMHGAKNCGRNQDCFQLHIPMNFTMLQAYNCDRQKPGEKSQQMPAEKQIYRPDYVKHHFIHYSTVTGYTILNREDVEKTGRKFLYHGAFPDPLSRFGDEKTEALMLHTKAVATQDTVFWETACNATYTGNALCRLGTPFPENMTGVDEQKGDEGWKMNCYINHKIEDYWVPLLEQHMIDLNHSPELKQRKQVELEAKVSL